MHGISTAESERGIFHSDRVSMTWMVNHIGGMNIWQTCISISIIFNQTLHKLVGQAAREASSSTIKCSIDRSLVVCFVLFTCAMLISCVILLSWLKKMKSIIFLMQSLIMIECKFFFLVVDPQLTSFLFHSQLQLEIYISLSLSHSLTFTHLITCPILRIFILSPPSLSNIDFSLSSSALFFSFFSFFHFSWC